VRAGSPGKPLLHGLEITGTGGLAPGLTVREIRQGSLEVFPDRLRHRTEARLQFPERFLRIGQLCSPELGLASSQAQAHLRASRGNDQENLQRVGVVGDLRGVDAAPDVSLRTPVGLVQAGKGLKRDVRRRVSREPGRQFLTGGP